MYLVKNVGVFRAPIGFRMFRSCVTLVWLVVCGACDRLSLDPVTVAQPDRPVATIAFGSCNDAFADQPLWTPIAAATPDVFIWTGDIVYADVAAVPPVRGAVRFRIPLPRVPFAADLRAQYAVQKSYEPYAQLRRNVRIIGIYDDHDYGENNAGREFGLRDASQRALLDFLDETPKSPRRRRPGAYAAYNFETPAGLLRIILLDTRYHREAPDPEGRRPDGADILGPAQWTWLADQLRDSPARLHWIVSSIQVVPEEHPYESWARYPVARIRLIDLLKRTRPSGLVLISGDRHLAEISRLRTPSGLDLIEVTASGMTHSVPPNWTEPNRYRQGELFAGLNFGVGRFTADGMILEIRDQAGRVVLSAPPVAVRD